MDLNVLIDFAKSNYVVIGNVLAFFGAAIGLGFAGYGASKGLGISGSAAAGATAQDEKNFPKFLVLESLPQTQLIYAFVIAILITMGVMGGKMTIEKGFVCIFVGIALAVMEGISGVYQGVAAAAAVGAAAKNPKVAGKVIVYVVMVELTALLGFVFSILVLTVNNIY
ncbi:MAG: permease [Candidatus Altiarchaeales archaeon]|nr:permease [Candidatus Altiarchaeales archaeon]